MHDLQAKLAVLPTLSSAQLRAEWMRVYRKPAPPLTSDLLRRGIAYRLQERVYGGLSTATLKEVDRLCRQFKKTGEVVAAGAAAIKPGTRLVREWGGRTHYVLVLQEGFLYEDRHYRSLSQIASAIAGVHWSGPRFFGLVKRRSVKASADA